MITPATPSAATASIMRSQGMPYFVPSHTPAEPEDDDERAPDVRRKMQRVGFERLAGIFFGDAAESARADEIDRHRQQQNQDRGEAGMNLRGAEEQPLKRFPDDVERGEKQQSRFDERGKALDFSVAVEMLRVGGLIRHAHGKIGDDRRDEIEDGMQRFGKNSQAARDRREEHLQRDEHDG